jgi:Tfp pilus assembly protein PilN
MIPNINLLPKLEKKAEGSKLLYVLMGVVSALTLGVFAFMFISSNMKVSDLEVRQQSLTAEQTALQAQLDSMQNMNAGSLEESLAFVERVSYPVSPLIDESKNLLTDNTYLRQYSFSAETVAISADFEMLSDVAKYVEALNGSKYFNDVQVTNVSNFEVNPVSQGEEVSQQRQESLKFQQLPRYTVEIALLIDSMYLATGGGN